MNVIYHLTSLKSCYRACYSDRESEVLGACKRQIFILHNDVIGVNASCVKRLRNINNLKVLFSHEFCHVYKTIWAPTCVFVEHVWAYFNLTCKLFQLEASSTDADRVRITVRKGCSLSKIGCFIGKLEFPADLARSCWGLIDISQKLFIDHEIAY
jgi:hypothetical protein